MRREVTHKRSTQDVVLVVESGCGVGQTCPDVIQDQRNFFMVLLATTRL